MYPDLPSCKKAILYAPTFRDYGVTSLFPFKDYDKKALDAFLKRRTPLFSFALTSASREMQAPIYLTG